jgi:predicted nucleic acid-binding protein
MMENRVFVDTSAWIGLLNADDEYHEKFSTLFLELRNEKRPLVTTDWVFAETGNGLARVRARLRFPQIVNMFLQSPNCNLVRVDADVFRHALELYESASDKSWGMVDCASFTVMRNTGIGDAATSDIHFEQAGFRRVWPKSF